MPNSVDISVDGQLLADLLNMNEDNSQEQTKPTEYTVDCVINGLSGVYRDGLTYAIGYLDGLGTIELIDAGPFTWPSKAQEHLDTLLKANEWTGNTLFVVGLSVSKLVSISTLENPVIPPPLTKVTREVNVDLRGEDAEDEIENTGFRG